MAKVGRLSVTNAYDRCSQNSSEIFKMCHRKTDRGMKNPYSYASSVGTREGCRPLPISLMKWFASLVAGFAFTSIEYISQYF